MGEREGRWSWTKRQSVHGGNVLTTLRQQCTETRSQAASTGPVAEGVRMMALMAAQHMDNKEGGSYIIIVRDGSSSYLGHGPHIPILSFDSEKAQPPVEAPARLFTMPESAASAFLLTTSGAPAHRSLDEINNQPPYTNKQYNRTSSTLSQPKTTYKSEEPE
ncbi:hypothetical protein AVEN_140015-1 [Araneus ventricosus]|uniref:Uncharacterized protein n=1 Tax=Araneus ventricosus TaxID=182803 RepID=A0A4Y2BIP3_ARAVE|nr:hypothetical protein AVEN_140015-1 [Araneus ventricosus]